jgi:hypothetical protein
MIVASLLLILVAVALLVLGLSGGSSPLLIASIVTSLFAAVALVIGARQSANARQAADSRAGDPRAADPRATDPRGAEAPADEPPGFGRPADEIYAAESADMAGVASPADSDLRETVQLEPVPPLDEPAAEPSWQHAEANNLAGGDPQPEPEFAEADEEDPADEPLPQAVSPADAVRVARMDAEVLVVDGRPRYHVPDCPHLVGRLTEPIPVNEAVELGFTPCGLCRPVDRLVAAAAHH